MPAKEVAHRPVQLGDAPAAADPVHHTGTDKMVASATEQAGHADDADGLGHIPPVHRRRRGRDRKDAAGQTQPVD